MSSLECCVSQINRFKTGMCGGIGHNIPLMFFWQTNLSFIYIISVHIPFIKCKFVCIACVENSFNANFTVRQKSMNYIESKVSFMFHSEARSRGYNKDANPFQKWKSMSWCSMSWTHYRKQHPMVHDTILCLHLKVFPAHAFYRTTKTTCLFSSADPYIQIKWVSFILLFHLLLSCLNFITLGVSRGDVFCPRLCL